MLEVAKHPSPPGNRRPTMTEGYDGRQVVGMDLHRRRSVLVRMTEDGRKLETVRITNSPVTHSDIFGAHGQAWLDELAMPQPYAGKVASLRQLAGELSAEITLLDAVLGDLLAGHEGYAAIQALPGIGPVLAAVIVAEIGDITRFRKPGQLGCWAGLTPRHRESDARVTRGHVSKQGPRILRWALCEAIQHQPGGTRPRQVKDGIIARRGPQ